MSGAKRLVRTRVVNGVAVWFTRPGAGPRLGLVLALCMLGGDPAGRGAEAIGIIETRAIEVLPPVAEATHELTLHAYVFRGGRWNVAELPPAVETAPEHDRLSDAQCELLRARGEANGLLRRRR